MQALGGAERSGGLGDITKQLAGGDLRRLGPRRERL